MLAPCEIIAASIGALFECEPVNQYIRIRTPFLYPDGDSLDLYLAEQGSTLTLTDLGDTLRWLWMQQVSERRTKKQEQLVQSVAASSGVELFKGMLALRVKDPNDLAQAVITLSQAALRIADVWFTFRSRSGETVIDDVVDFLSERKFSFEQDARLVGRSGKIWKVDFQVRHPRRSSLVKILSTGSRAAAKQVTDSTVATWYDLSHLRHGPEALQFVSLLDDTTDVWSAEDIRRVGDISDVAFWSRPDELTEKLVA
jgi:hypothetical protein